MQKFKVLLFQPVDKVRAKFRQFCDTLKKIALVL